MNSAATVIPESRQRGQIGGLPSYFPPSLAFVLLTPSPSLSLTNYKYP